VGVWVAFHLQILNTVFKNISFMCYPLTINHIPWHYFHRYIYFHQLQLRNYCSCWYKSRKSSCHVLYCHCSQCRSIRTRPCKCRITQQTGKGGTENYQGYKRDHPQKCSQTFTNL
jgi:hypothetical protein